MRNENEYYWAAMWEITYQLIIVSMMELCVRCTATRTHLRLINHELRWLHSSPHLLAEPVCTHWNSVGVCGGELGLIKRETYNLQGPFLTYNRSKWNYKSVSQDDTRVWPFSSFVCRWEWAIEGGTRWEQILGADDLEELWITFLALEELKFSV